MAVIKISEIEHKRKEITCLQKKKKKFQWQFCILYYKNRPTICRSESWRNIWENQNKQNQKDISKKPTQTKELHKEQIGLVELINYTFQWLYS